MNTSGQLPTPEQFDFLRYEEEVSAGRVERQNPDPLTHEEEQRQAEMSRQGFLTREEEAVAPAARSLAHTLPLVDSDLSGLDHMTGSYVQARAPSASIPLRPPSPLSSLPQFDAPFAPVPPADLAQAQDFAFATHQAQGQAQGFAPGTDPHQAQNFAPDTAFSPQAYTRATSQAADPFQAGYPQQPTQTRADDLSVVSDAVTTADEAPSPPKRRAGLLRMAVEFVIVLAVAMALTWALKAFLIEPFEVPTGSMETTIMIGDKLLADKYTINFTPVNRGDIVVFADKVEPGRILIKRVIATGGQTIDLRDGRVYVDDSLLFEPYVNGAASLPLSQHFNNMFIDYPFIVPEGHLWVMGDNRAHSADSRYFGSIDATTVYGRALLVFWPLNRIGPL
ncbi:MAG: signal peptidase I [Coriobacteriales bacterium]|jgi:signal peptidase I|nr:signal peptidase I [Coriobacteriales bacterium]